MARSMSLAAACADRVPSIGRVSGRRPSEWMITSRFSTSRTALISAHDSTLRPSAAEDSQTVRTDVQHPAQIPVRDQGREGDAQAEHGQAGASGQHERWQAEDGPGDNSYPAHHYGQ